MHVLSTEQFIRHLGRTRGQRGALLDIGAGDGGVTAKMAPLFDAVYCTESDWAMRWRLRRRRYKYIRYMLVYIYAYMCVSYSHGFS